MTAPAAAPSDRGSETESGWRLPLRLTEILAVVVTLTLGYLVIDHLSLTGGDLPPYVRSVDAGHTAHLSYADVRVTQVTTAGFLAGPDGAVLKPAGVFLLASVAVRPTREPTLIASVWLVDNQGRIFRPSTGSGCDNSFQTSTGIITYSLLCFEVPPSLLAQLRLEVARGDQVDNDTRNDDVADLGLGITATAARTLAAPTTGYRVVPSSTTRIRLTPVTLAAS